MFYIVKFLHLTFGMLLCSLVQWLKHSRKEYCELCKHRFAFTPSEYTCDTDGSPTLKYPTQFSQQLLGPYEFSSITLQLLFHHNCYC